MRQNVILAGVGGQGILTIAEAISSAALRRGLQVKQAEVHGMAQRGGGVQSHLRFADGEVHSDLIPVGEADLLIAVEPLECLRYMQYLKDGGAVVASINAFVNIGNYPPVESVLERLSALPRHVLIDAERIARAAGSGRAANIAILGAASLFLDLEPGELEDAIAAMFARKGPQVIEANQRAFRFGRNAGQAYLDGLGRGGHSVAVRHWIDTLDAGHLAAPEAAGCARVRSRSPSRTGCPAPRRTRSSARSPWSTRKAGVSSSSTRSIRSCSSSARSPRRSTCSCPRKSMISEEALARFPGDQVVLKIVSPDVVHKTDAAGIAFVRKDCGHGARRSRPADRAPPAERPTSAACWSSSTSSTCGRGSATSCSWAFARPASSGR